MNEEKTILCTGKFLALVKEGRWEYAHRVNATGAAIIASVTDDGKLLLVEQFRIPVNSRTIELPAGMTGDDGVAESNAEAARRELLEETGYDAAEVEELITGPSSSGLTSERVTLFRARGLRRRHAGGGVGNEDIIVHEVPLAAVHEWLMDKSRHGYLIEPKVFAGLYWLGAQK